MGTIISLDKKLKRSLDKQDAIIRKRKLLAVRKIFRCAHCTSKCEKCGVMITVDNRSNLPTFRIPYTFCDSCTEEYVDYIEALKGNEDSSLYWHNDAWMKVWATWIEHQGAVDSYLKSKEFEQLLDELKPNQT
ncbi:hypothetical protein [Desulfosarcina sp.]|uniref:hypothetical protein n=1 Tax=Desulfosarcina sp. TaxID=2027861 RepID=UPI003970D68D